MLNNIKNIDGKVSIELIRDQKLDEFLQFLSISLEWPKISKKKN